MSFLKQEAEHVEGFAPQVAWATQGGDDVLEERLAIRPTSEAMIWADVRKWIQSWRDLPSALQPVGNVIRWEKSAAPVPAHGRVPVAGGHTAHETEQEAIAEALKRPSMTSTPMWSRT